MAGTFHLNITTLERKEFSAEVDQVTMPTAQGEITVLPHHQALIAIIIPGALHIKQAGEEVLYAVSGGFVEVQGNKVTVLANSAERAEDIKEDEIEAARQRAETIMREQRHDAEAFAEAAAVLEKNLARLRVVRRLKRHVPGEDERERRQLER